MYIFNPEHDLCLANGDIHFVPPESALALGRDCGSITKYMRGLDSNADNGAKIVPWGWNYVLRERLLKEGVSSSILPSDEQLDHIRLFSGRSLAFEAHEFLLGFLSRIPVSRNLYAAPSGCRKMCRSAAELDTFLRSYENIVLKAPLSGSGKGIRFVRGTLSHSDRGWAENLMRRYGYLVAERRAEILDEFAFLYEVAAGRVLFKGYSMFYSHNGVYKGNILASDSYIEAKMAASVPRELLWGVGEGLAEFIRQRLCGKYEGFLGVDLYFYKGDDGKILCQPVSEINLRMTMGLIARNIYDNRSTLLNMDIGEGTHAFEICSNLPAKGSYSYRFVPACRAASC